MDGVIRINIVNVLTIGVIAVAFVFAGKWAAKSFAPSLVPYI